jgi:hypothetical protein
MMRDEVEEDIFSQCHNHHCTILNGQYFVIIMLNTL